MDNADDLKELVRQKYSEIALQDKETNQSSCCSAGGCSTEVYNIMSEGYDQLQGYPDADLGLGCGLPTQFARIKKGDLVIDLGSGVSSGSWSKPMPISYALGIPISLITDFELRRRWV